MSERSGGGGGGEEEPLQTLTHSIYFAPSSLGEDKSPSTPLPGADFLNLFQVVITSTERLSNAWKAGNNESKVGNNNGQVGTPKPNYNLDNFDYSVGANKNRKSSVSAHSPLLDIYWLRLVIDEGHFFAKTQISNSIQFASWIEARARWACTGTPTPQTNKSALPAILGLLHFLQHDFFSRLNDNFAQMVAKGFNNGDPSAFFRLKNLLQLIMVRHTKDAIVAIPKVSEGLDEVCNFLQPCKAFTTGVNALELWSVLVIRLFCLFI